VDGQAGTVLSYAPAEGGDLNARLADGRVTVIAAPTDMSMRAAIELRQASGHPVALVEAGRLVGVCGDEEIYRGILRQTDIAAASVPHAKAQSL
jgi:glycine betaine/proline transport system ATP-binding protein